MEFKPHCERVEESVPFADVEVLSIRYDVTSADPSELAKAAANDLLTALRFSLGIERRSLRSRRRQTFLPLGRLSEYVSEKSVLLPVFCWMSLHELAHPGN
jgi:hypothetical protein